MKLKIDESGNAVLDNGNPVYVNDVGKEITLDPPAMHLVIGKVNVENRRLREANENAEALVKAFDGIDAAAARKAMELVKNLDDSKLIDAGKVEEIRAAAVKSVEDKYKPITEEAERLKRELYTERVGGQFARSKYIAEKTILPPDIAQAAFGQYFELKDGKILARDASGNTIYSDANPGNPADFDEALEKLVSGSANRDRILKGSGHTGSGTNGVDGSTGARVVTREQLAKMNPMQSAKTAEAIGKGEVKLVD
jgi:hypothetical protein